MAPGKFLIFEALPLAREGSEALAKKGEFGCANGQFAFVGQKQWAFDADEVAEIDGLLDLLVEFVACVGVLVEAILLQAYLDFAVNVLNCGEGEFAHGSAEGDSAGEANGFAVNFVWFALCFFGFFGFGFLFCVEACFVGVDFMDSVAAIESFWVGVDALFSKVINLFFTNGE